VELQLLYWDLADGNAFVQSGLFSTSTNHFWQKGLLFSLQEYGAFAFSFRTNLHTVNRCLEKLEEMKIHDNSV
jgi:hypothetical protein